MVNTSVKFCGINFKNPIVAASGTFGFGREYSKIYDLGILGGIASKGLTLHKKEGNEGIRIWETPMGIMNSIGLENPGVRSFIEDELDFMKSLNTNIIINIGGSTEEEYLEAVEYFNELEIDMIELNISCPNVKEGCMAFGLTDSGAGDIVSKVRKVTKHPLVVKLSPNAEDIIRVAQACEYAGADGLSLINTIRALAIDIKKRKPVFQNLYAGLSGPAIKPIALRMVHEVCNNVNIPVMGIGGISNYRDVVEFMMAGAQLVQVGTANLVELDAGRTIIEDLKEYMQVEGLKSLEEIRGII
ncbi:MAG: dihydroorotate dehydrogenase [Peptostreptococcales bacterium]